MKISSSSNLILLLMILISISLQITPILAIQRQTTPAATTEFLKTSCKAAVYPDLCFNSLYTQANAIQTSSMLLANAALSVTLATARTTSAMVFQMSKDAGMRPREAGAMRDCLEVLRDTVKELQQSITEMGDIKSNKNFGLQMNDIQTWVSAALTNEDTCTEGFGGKIMDGKLKTVMFKNQLNQKLKLMVENPGIGLSSNTPPHANALWA